MTCSSSTICRPRRLLAALLLLAASASGQGALADTAEDLILEAQAFLKKGDGIAAEAKLRTALDRGAQRRVVAAAMGEALLAQGNHRRASEWLRTEDFAPQTAAQGYFALARLERAKGNLRKAGSALDKALAITPENPGLWVEIGRLRYAGGEHLLAIEAADRAVALGRDDPAALLLKAQLVRDADGMVPALAWLERAHAAAPGDIAIMGELAATQGEAGEARAMLATTRAMLDRDPGNARAFYLQAVLAARAGNYALARRLLARTGGQLDALPGKRLLDGIAELGVGNYSLAVAALEPLYREQPGNRRVRDLLVRALFLAGEHRALAERFVDVARGQAGSAYLRTVVGRAYEQLDRREDAAPLLEMSAKRAPLAVKPRDGTRLGALLLSGRGDEARALASARLHENPGYYDNLATAGDAALAMGDGATAARHYEQAARIRQTESLMQRRFQAFLVAGRTQDAAYLSRRFLSANPRSPAAIRTAAWLAARTGDWPRALVLHEALARNGQSRDVQLLADLSQVQLRAGESDAAVETARRAYLLQRANPIAAQAWGLALIDARQAPRLASALLEKARAVMGDNPLLAEARLRLATIG